MKILRFAMGALVASTIACGGSDDEPQVSKGESAERLFRVSSTLQTLNTAVFSGAAGATNPANAGLSPQSLRPAAESTVEFSVNCPGGGTAAVKFESETEREDETTQSALRYEASYAACNTGQSTIDGGPLTINFASSYSGTGGESGAAEFTATYNGGVAITGNEAGTYGFDNLQIKVSTNLSGSTYSVSMVVNGTFTINGTRYEYANEQFANVSGSR